MKTCPKCAESIQDEAKVCRYCGHSFEYKFPEIGCGGMALITIAGLFFLSVLIPEDHEEKTKRERETVALQQVWRTEDVVKKRLRDPSSAKFTHINTKCGYVNSRNGFGGMSGDTGFVVIGNTAILSEDDAKNFRKLWAEHCQ